MKRSPCGPAERKCIENNISLLLLHKQQKNYQNL